ncbi:hypothetical protein RHSIM_Rhsim08G0131200 [Rhododendron simsii]|uniref:Protein SAR DEFICIENT 1 n=1 Tax=Rhododendron simsii TaxID=118357 RepID=A0A834LGD2_RHOSS|nr:hypothetical protein RHSIM_Rhsim08G0131200 [Rhododendron simsii]
MAAKRFFNDSDSEQPNGKRMRTRPSFASVIGEVVMVNCLKNFCSALEPMLRKVVSEEVENGIQRGARSLTRSPSLRIQALEPSSLQLIFSKKLSLPIFTGSKIVDIENSPLHILLVDKTCGDRLVPTSLPFTLKVEIVVLDGDFPPAGGHETWTSDGFDKNVVKERTGKRPLLNGELQFTMRDGFAPFGEVEFTDNSSWIRSRKFRLGARVVQGSSRGFTVREAMTEPFVVKDHRGELYKKHHPPMLEDEVWRLEKIGKDGAFHKKLTSMGINTVQDFLKLSVVDPSKLRKILGIGMSEKMWEVTIKHARSCIMGNKFYISRGPNYTLMLNPVCQVIKAVINEQTYPTTGITSMHKAYIENLVREAFANWNSLEEVDGLLLNETPLLLTQGNVVEQYPNHHQQSMATSYDQQHLPITDGSMEVASGATNRNMECNDHWLVNSTLFSSPIEAGVHCNFSESSSDDDLPPARRFIHHT